MTGNLRTFVSGFDGARPTLRYRQIKRRCFRANGAEVRFYDWRNLLRKPPMGQ